MSYISIKEFSEIRKSVTKRREDISKEIESKKSISKKQCHQWIDDICDLVISYDPVLSLTAPAMQPFIKLVDIDSLKNHKSEETTNAMTAKQLSKPSTSSSTKNNEEEEEEEIEIIDDQIVAKSSASENVGTRDGTRYKGVIRGLDSLTNGNNSDDNWSQTDSKNPSKKSKTTRKTRSRQTKNSNSKRNDKELSNEESGDWTSGGQVLGGDIPSETSTSMSAEERRRLLAEKSEQRLAKMTTRGAKGIVNLTARAQADIPDDSTVRDSKLQWKI